MNKSELEKTINILEQIREILLKDGISSEVADTTLQKICNQIDALYGEPGRVGTFLCPPNR